MPFVGVKNCSDEKLNMSRLFLLYATVSPFLVFPLSGCAPHFAISKAKPEALVSVSDMDLCAAFSESGAASVRAEIEKRGKITQDEWELIEGKKIRIGMSEAAMICSWGEPPAASGRVNSTITQYGERKQYVYRESRISSAQYVYVTNGRVSAIQR